MSYYDAQVERAVVTLTDVLEYTFCPRFIFYMRCLDIPQHEEKRFKVRKGREVHEARAMTNKRYLRHKIIKDGDYAHALLTIKDILKMIDTGYYPANLRPTKRCSDCCHSSICV